MESSTHIEVWHPVAEHQREILSPEALGLLAEVTREFGPRLRALLAAREARQAALDAGSTLGFDPGTAAIREGSWRVAPAPPALRRRHVEITGPVSRKMVINALNSGADLFMADFEDSTSPTFDNVIDGQVNLRDAVRGDIGLVDAARNRTYALVDDPAVLLVRPRGLHLPEAHLRLEGRPVPAAFADFVLYVFHNAQALVDRGHGPYVYLPKLEHHLEARLWNDVFCLVQDRLGLPRGTVRATVLIETLPAAFQMDEILWELRDHAAGLNCGRWDYIFSYIKTQRANARCVLPDRGQVGMTQPFMEAYTRLVVQTCHRRGAHAMGGMAAQIPIKGDDAANDAALARVREDKRREARGGHDGTWVAHPGLVPVAREAFAEVLQGRDHQLERPLDASPVTAEDLLRVPEGTRTDTGLRQNVRVGVQYVEAWLRGVGCVPLEHLMEDAATAEISRAQLWQWIARGAHLDDGRQVTPALVRETAHEEVAALLRGDDPRDRFDDAAGLFLRLVTEQDLAPFLTTPGYAAIERSQAPAP